MATKKKELKDIWSFSGPYRFLSNFYPVSIVYDAIQYPTVEHAFQASKTLDRDQRLVCACKSTAAAAKRFGQIVKLRDDWNDVRINVMHTLLRMKFDLAANPALAKSLLDTCLVQLVEGNTWGDRFWGVCSGAGENNLGKLLMLVREELRVLTSVRGSDG